MSEAQLVPGPVPAAGVAPSREAKGFAGKARFWLLWPALVALDLWSKSVVFTFLAARARAGGDGHRPEALWPPYRVFDSELLRFELVSWGNTGTLWGLGQNATIPLMVLRCCAVVGLLWFLRNTARAAKLQQLVLALILAGAIGNLFDNFTRADRSVRDFLFFSGKWPVAWTFPAFNVADACITVGAIGLFVLLWRDDRRPKAGAREPAGGEREPVPDDPEPKGDDRKPKPAPLS
jgi:lipoprotein signal peptidase